MIRYNLELALHGLRRFPRSTLLAVLTVALGLAASMTTLTLLHVLSADPLPGLSQHLYLAWTDTVQAEPIKQIEMEGITMNVNYKHIRLPDAEALLLAHRAVRQTALADMSADVADGDGRHQQKQQTLLATTSSFIPMFGVTLRYGRGWSAAEDIARAPVAVIDLDLAQKLFGTGNAVGKNIRVKDVVFQVIGVISPFVPQPHFYEVQSWTYSATDRENLFVPYTAALDAGLEPNSDSDGCDASLSAAARSFNATFGKEQVRYCAWLSYWVQLDTPRQQADYRSYLMHYAEQQKALAGYKKPSNAELYGVSAWLKKWNVIPDSVRLNVWMAISFLLLCMVNVAGLLAARFLHRSGEIGIRRALGAPRRSIFLQHILEASAVCVVGGVMALPLTLLGLHILRQQSGSFNDLARLDPLMFVLLFVLALAAGVVTGVVPAWRASAVEPGLQVKSE
ncbi:MAG: ABC transporter permease [Pseudoxanthomonas sp.]